MGKPKEEVLTRTQNSMRRKDGHKKKSCSRSGCVFGGSKDVGVSCEADEGGGLTSLKASGEPCPRGQPACISQKERHQPFGPTALEISMAPPFSLIPWLWQREFSKHVPKHISCPTWSYAM